MFTHTLDYGSGRYSRQILAIPMHCIKIQQEKESNHQCLYPPLEVTTTWCLPFSITLSLKEDELVILAGKY